MNVEFTLPELGENIESGDVVSVLVREGDVIACNDGVIEVETEKAVVEIPCPHAGKVVKVHVAKGQTIKVGQRLLAIEAEAEVPEKPRPTVAQPPSAVQERQEQPGATVPQTDIAIGSKPKPPAAPAGPDARRVARELGVDLAQVQGTGKGGRITVEDVRRPRGRRGICSIGSGRRR